MLFNCVTGEESWKCRSSAGFKQYFWSIENVDVLWRLVWNCESSLEVWGCLQVSSGDPELSLLEGVRAVLRNTCLNFQCQAPHLDPFLCFNENSQTYRFFRDIVMIR